MKRSVLVGVWIILAFVCSSQAQTVTAEDKKAAGEVLATIAKWADAVRDRNTRSLDQIFADDIVITSFDGSVRGKKEEMEVLKPNPAIRTESVTNEDVGLKIFGDVAVVTALTKLNFIVQDKPQPFAMRYTAVFVKREGRWQIVALQSGRVSK